MKEILEQLASQVGVRLTALVMDDGVPVHACRGSAAGDAKDDTDALAALSAGWALEVCGSIAPLAWDKPQRMALRGSHGTLVLRRAHTAWLLVILVEGLRIEDVLLAMDGTAARLERFVRGLADRVEGASAPAPALPGKRNEQGGVGAPPLNTEQKLP